MANKALGLIEVRGMLGAVLAADAALKAANVELLGNYSIPGGLTTVELLGDVAAVYAAVEAGVDSVKDMNLLISSHVIPRLDEQVERMLMKKYEVKNNEAEVDSSVEEEENESKEESTKEESQENSEEDSTNEDTENPPEVPEEKELEEMKVVDLRSLAYKRNIQALTKKEIKYANKAELIRVLVKEGMEDK
ncbi:BMC domain-containing protein [Jeotgalibaca sp. MA1X17-3]|uniref:BMC domain-containing protein n=1 Tax=Jeotgalibaca sp. MA1X17-3 TaxID=2908211 RepID=UPI001F1ECD8E|nr:BMC domain-containing protein [Jeotgalibaca sp. MA1X17-3]UJF15313.1 BMC domain-containing protein [Jeotgalibaca sp. MA1X17-3]